MNKKLVCAVFAAGLLGTTAIATVVFNQTFAKNRGVQGTGYNVSLNGTTNVLENGAGSGTIALSDRTNTRTLSYSGYTHSSESAWGVLANNGYFQLVGRIGGLTSIHYSVSADLKLEYGYVESEKPTYYDAILANNSTDFNFNETLGYPDTFKVTNLSGGDVTITDMTFYYTCSQIDGHAHVVREVVREDNKYYNVCDICSEKYEVDFNSYSIKIGPDSEHLIEYTPYNLSDYSGVGSLEFDYQNLYSNSAKRFVLTIDGDQSGSTLYMDSNVTHHDNSQIIIKSQNSAEIGDFTFKGGYGTLVFMGDTLTFDGSTLDTEAHYTSVKSPLVFTGLLDRSKDGIFVNNGKLILENNVTISGRNRGIRFYQNAYNGDLQQSSGTLNISQCNWGISGVGATYYPTLLFTGTTNISGCRRAIQRCNVQVGNDSTAGKLMIDVDISGSSKDDPSVGIYMSNSNTVNFYKGSAAIYSSNTDTSWNDAVWNDNVYGGSYSVGLKVSLSSQEDRSKFSWNSDFVFGLGNLARGFDNSGGSDVQSFFGPTGIRACFLHTYHLCDSAWYLSSKPTTNAEHLTEHASLGDLLAAF